MYKKDGYCSGLFNSRSSERFVDEFINRITLENQTNKQKGLPMIDINDYEVYCIGMFDDEKISIEPTNPPVRMPIRISEDNS